LKGGAVGVASLRGVGEVTVSGGTRVGALSVSPGAVVDMRMVGGGVVGVVLAQAERNKSRRKQELRRIKRLR
jgi:hypothetical protein